MAGTEVAQFCKKMVVSFGVEQAPNQFSIRTTVTGLPNLNEVLKKYGPMLSGIANMAAPMQQRQAKAAAVAQEARAHEARAMQAAQEAHAARKAIESEVKANHDYD